MSKKGYCLVIASICATLAGCTSPEGKYRAECAGYHWKRFLWANRYIKTEPDAPTESPKTAQIREEFGGKRVHWKGRVITKELFPMEFFTYAWETGTKYIVLVDGTYVRIFADDSENNSQEIQEIDRGDKIEFSGVVSRKGPGVQIEYAHIEKFPHHWHFNTRYRNR